MSFTIILLLYSLLLVYMYMMPLFVWVAFLSFLLLRKLVCYINVASVCHESHPHYIKLVLFLFVLFILVQLFEVGGIGTPQLHVGLRPHVHHTCGDGQDHRPHWVPLREGERRRWGGGWVGGRNWLMKCYTHVCTHTQPDILGREESVSEVSS